jgi:hypothetical protein
MTSARLRARHLLSEKDWQRLVVDAAKAFGWWHYHPHDSRHSQAGWPDLVLMRPPEVMFVELKRQDGKVTALQGAVLADLEACGLECHVWRPSDEPDVLARLRRRP